MIISISHNYQTFSLSYSTHHPSHHQVASPSPDRTLPNAHVGPIDYTRQEMIKQEVIKQEAVQPAVTDIASGTTPASSSPIFCGHSGLCPGSYFCLDPLSIVNELNLITLVTLWCFWQRGDVYFNVYSTMIKSCGIRWLFSYTGKALKALPVSGI